MWVSEVGVRDGNRYSGPIGAEPATETIRVGTSAEVVVAGFCVTFLAFKLVAVLRARICIGPLAAEGSQVRVVANTAGVVGHNTRRAEEVLHVILRRATSGQHRDTPAAEEDVFSSHGTGGVGFGQDFVARAVPLQLAVGFGEPPSSAVVEIIDAGC